MFSSGADSFSPANLPAFDLATLVATNQAASNAEAACEDATRQLISYATDLTRSRRTWR